MKREACSTLLSNLPGRVLMRQASLASLGITHVHLTFSADNQRSRLYDDIGHTVKK